MSSDKGGWSEWLMVAAAVAVVAMFAIVATSVPLLIESGQQRFKRPGPMKARGYYQTDVIEVGLKKGINSGVGITVCLPPDRPPPLEADFEIIAGAMIAAQTMK